MNYLVIDTENSGALRNKAHPFDPQNKLLLLGVRHNGVSSIYDIEYSGVPYGSHISALRELISSVGFLVGFNIKYDLHWLARYGLFLGSETIKVWDCQLAEFILSHQSLAYPDLGTSCAMRGVSLKRDTLKAYIDAGVEVSSVPLNELSEYLEGDLVSTEELFLKQYDLIEPYWELFDLQCQDLLVLAEMEWNGLKYDIEKSKLLATSSFDEETAIIEKLNALVNAPVCINWNSGDHLSAILYGGRISFIDKEPIGYFKSGAKAGQVRYKNVEKYIEFPRIVEPLEGSELEKDGLFSTAENVLKELKAEGIAKEIITLIQEQAKINKIRTTYYEGIPKKFEHFGWEDNLVHGQINQCVARTGRTSSSNPNLQNNSIEAKECFVTRFS